jgi:hypothetical protein
MDNYTLPHEEIMKDENLSYRDLPDEIQGMIDDFEEMKADYEELPSEEGLEVLIKESVIIADEIQDFLEMELSDSDEEDDYDDDEKPKEEKKGYQKSSFRFW